MQSLEICGQNFIDANCSLVVSSGDATKGNIYDQRPLTQHASVGSADGSSHVLTVTFKDRDGATITRAIDRLILLNCNLSRFSAEYWDGSAWQTITESVFGAGTENASENVRIAIATPISTTMLRLTMTHTFGDDDQKLIGELKACALVTAVRHLVSVDREDWDDGGSFRLQGGSLVTYINVSKFEGRVEMDQVTLATYLLVAPLIQARSWMTWLLYYDFHLAHTFEVKATSSLKEKWDKKTQLVSLSLDVKER